MYETSCQSSFDARYWMLGAGAHTHTQGITTQLPGVHIVPQKILQEQISSPNIIYFMFWSLYTRLTAIICTLLGSSKFLQRVGDQIQNHECS